LTAFNPVVNWKFNALSLVAYGKTHVLLGSQRSGLPSYVVSSLDVKEHVDLGEPVYVMKLNAVEDIPYPNTYNLPELEQLL
jgi:hypothetical protein